MTTLTESIRGADGTVHHCEVVRVRDLTSGNVIDLDASAPCDRISKRDAQGAGPGVDREAPATDWAGLTLADLRTGDIAYVASDDAGDTAGTVTWWLSEIVDIATAETPIGELR